MKRKLFTWEFEKEHNRNTDAILKLWSYAIYNILFQLGLILKWNKTKQNIYLVSQWSCLGVSLLYSIIPKHFFQNKEIKLVKKAKIYSYTVKLPVRGPPTYYIDNSPGFGSCILTIYCTLLYVVKITSDLWQVGFHSIFFILIMYLSFLHLISFSQISNSVCQESEYEDTAYMLLFIQADAVIDNLHWDDIWYHCHSNPLSLLVPPGDTLFFSLMSCFASCKINIYRALTVNWISHSLPRSEKKRVKTGLKKIGLVICIFWTVAIATRCLELWVAW